MASLCPSTYPNLQIVQMRCAKSAQDRMVSRENARRREVHYEPGELVLLSTKNLNQPGPGIKKLKPSYMGPFEVDRVIGKVAVRLHLPAQWT
eukprot:1142777-Pelagomonas_calceolata.AAC.1